MYIYEAHGKSTQVARAQAAYEKADQDVGLSKEAINTIQNFVKKSEVKEETTTNWAARPFKYRSVVGNIRENKEIFWAGVFLIGFRALGWVFPIQDPKKLGHFIGPYLLMVVGKECLIRSIFDFCK